MSRCVRAHCLLDELGHDLGVTLAASFRPKLSCKIRRPEPMPVRSLPRFPSTSTAASPAKRALHSRAEVR
jgi:hypothetical protein